MPVVYCRRSSNAFLVKQAAEKLGVPLGDVNCDGELTIAIVNTILQKDETSSSAAGARAKMPALPTSALPLKQEPQRAEPHEQEPRSQEPLSAF